MSGKYFINFRIGKERFSRSLKTDDVEEADAAVACVEENLRLSDRAMRLQQFQITPFDRL